MGADDVLRAADPVPAERRTPRTDRRPRLALAAGVVGVVILGVAVAAVLRPGPTPSAADEPFYATASELEARADVLVRGTVLTAQDTRDDGYPQTIGTVEVAAVAAGDVTPGDEITASWVTPGTTALSAAGPQVGGEYVLLLEDVEGALVLVSQGQGWYTVSDGRAVPGEDNPVTLTTGTLSRLGLG